VLDVPAPDTLLVELDGQPTSVRLLGIYVPVQDSFAAATRAFLARLLKGESVYLQSDPGWPQDPRGTRWAYVYRAPDGQHVNLELIRQGYARVAAGADFQQRELLCAYERLARQHGKGLWASAAPPRVTSSPTSQPAASQNAGTDGANLVYVTPQGRKYHRQECPHARRGATALPLAEAKRRGYAPCSRCRPPE